MSKGVLKINKIDNIRKFYDCEGDHVKKVELFFFNEHISDPDLKELSRGIVKLLSIDSLVADFGE